MTQDAIGLYNQMKIPPTYINIHSGASKTVSSNRG